MYFVYFVLYSFALSGTKKSPFSFDGFMQLVAIADENSLKF